MREGPEQGARHNRAERNDPDRRCLFENEEIAIGTQAGTAVEEKELLAVRDLWGEKREEERKKQSGERERREKSAERKSCFNKIIISGNFYRGNKKKTRRTTYLRELVLPSTTTKVRTLGGRFRSNWRSMPAI